MTNLLTKLVFGLLRHVATPVTMWLNSRDILVADETLQILMELTVFGVAYAGSTFNKIFAARQVNTVIAISNDRDMPNVATTDGLKAVMNAGVTAPAMTPGNVAPVLSGKE